MASPKCDYRMNKMFVYLLVAINILAVGQCGALSVLDRLRIEGLVTDSEGFKDQQTEPAINRAIDYAVDLGCKNLNGKYGL